MSNELQRVEPGEGRADMAVYTPDRYNCLAPITVVGPDVPWLRVSAVVVKLDPDKDHGDCYPAPGTSWTRLQDGSLIPDKVAPAKPGLMKIASAMGIVWRVQVTEAASHRLAKSMMQGMPGDEARKLFDSVRYDVAYRAQVAVRDGTGWRFLEASYEWELESQRRKIEREARKAQTKHAETKAKFDSGEWKKKPSGWKDAFDFDAYVEDRLDQVISDRHALAETKAVLRAIRATGVRQVYTREEFAKPFVVQRVDLVPDMGDPATRAALAQKALSSSSELFGPEREASPALPPPSGAISAPDFEEAEREGRFEKLPPVDPVAETHVEDDNGNGEEPEPPGPWDDAPTSPAAPFTEAQANARLAEVWRRVQAAGLEAKVGTLARDASVSAKVSWCDEAERVLAAAGGAE